MSEILDPSKLIDCAKDLNDSLRYPVGVDVVVNFMHTTVMYRFQHDKSF